MTDLYGRKGQAYAVHRVGPRRARSQSKQQREAILGDPRFEFRLDGAASGAVIRAIARSSTHCAHSRQLSVDITMDPGSSSSMFPPALYETLTAWFAQYGQNPVFEVECRIKDVGAAAFERVLQTLLSNKSWSNCPIKPHLSLDMVHASKVRETQAFDISSGRPSGPTTFLRKVRQSECKVDTPSGHAVRFQVSSETETSAAPPPIDTYRHKERYTFVHKNLFKFELTRVKQGPTDEAARRADTTFEIELEFCGHDRPEASQAEYLADSMCMKVSDLLVQLTRGASTGGAGLKRQRSGAGQTGELLEGDEVELIEGTEVLLEPSGQGIEPRYNGEMPAELVPRWLFSHKEADGRVHVMSEPARIGSEHFPLFYFCGTVPANAARPRRQS